MTMKDRMSNVDVTAVVAELQGLVGTHPGKIYQDTYTSIRLRIGRDDLLIESGRRAHLTKYAKTTITPHGFPMLLRKHLSGGKIASITQPNFDRLIEIEVGRGDGTKFLIAELLTKGNIILLDGEKKIIQPLSSYKFRDRKILRGEKYVHPPPLRNPMSISLEELKGYFSSATKDLVRSLATDFGLGGMYAEEICASSGLEKNAAKLSDDEVAKLHNQLTEFFEPFRSHNFKPHIVMDGGRQVDVLPVELKCYGQSEKVYFETFSDALDEFFIKKSMESAGDREELKRTLEMQKEAVGRLGMEETEYTKKAEAIYANYADAEKALAEKKRGEIEVEFDGMKIALDAKLSLAKNAEKYYNMAKEARRKLEGLQKAIEETRKKLEAPATAGSAPTPQRKVRMKQKWYDKFHWFITSDGFLVVGGKDADTNEELVSKHLEKDDLFFHTQEKGSVVILKTAGVDPNEASEKALREAAIFATSYSSYWRSGFYEGDCYFVTPEQVSKTPESGEYIKKGGFVIRGKRNYFTCQLGLAVGIEINEETRLICGPSDVIKSRAKYSVEIEPGDMPMEKIANMIYKRFLEISAVQDRKVVETLATRQNIIALLPQGGSKFK